MLTQFTDPFAVRTFVTLRPDLLVREREQEQDGLLDLAGLFSGPGPYNTVRLAWGAEMHHHPASSGDSNDVASALAELCGYDPMDIRGTVHFTGNSRESDSAPGMDDENHFALLEALAQVCNAQGVRLWRQYRPCHTVMIRATDYAPGDLIWDHTGTQHRFASLEPYPPTSDLARRHPDARRYVCTDGCSMPAPSHGHGMRADRAPAGYWQRTGNQLLPAAD
ncbi:hypothetical protein J7E93_06380 [Streptomyces sp. ISL-36]|uniref:hypothetical protein n=1 Tax=Streptomyces sp. ISL-36 TaxID=2819182 RepID=UPI001BE758A7|nr:hypothetical protein [Streptomyces sp. ISL-36]MBT2439753.1 hypothetical protein [Streptomyces sp. ISL-36]